MKHVVYYADKNYKNGFSLPNYSITQKINNIILTYFAHDNRRQCGNMVTVFIKNGKWEF